MPFRDAKVNLRQLSYFVRIAQTGSFSAAADALHVAQSALSRHIKDLEYELGGELLDRGPRGVTLSDSGQVLFDRAQFILSQLEDAHSEVLAHNKDLMGTVRLLAPSSIGQLLFEPLVDRFLGKFPKVRLELSEGLWNDAVSRLQTGAVDLAVVTGPKTSDYLDLEPLANEHMTLVGKEGDPLLDKPSIAFGALADLRLMMPAVTLDFIRSFAPHHAEKLNVSIFVESSPAIRALVASGHGYAVVPRSVLLGKLEDRKIKGVRIRGLEAVRQLAALRGRPKSRAMRELSMAVRLEFDHLIGAGLMQSPKGSAPRREV